MDKRDEYINSLELEIRRLGSTRAEREAEERRQEFRLYASVWIAIVAVTGWAI